MVSRGYIQAGIQIQSTPYGQHVPQQYGVPFAPTEAHLPPAYQTLNGLYRPTLQFGPANNQVPSMPFATPTIQNASVMPLSHYIPTGPFAHYVPHAHIDPVMTGTRLQPGPHILGTHTPMMRATNPPWMPRGMHNIQNRPHIAHGPYMLASSFLPPGHYVNPVQTHIQTSQSLQLTRNTHAASRNQTLVTNNTATNQRNPQIVVNEKTVREQQSPAYTNLISDVTNQHDEQTAQHTDRQLAHLPDIQNTEVASPHVAVSLIHQQPLMDDPSIIDITPTPREDDSLRTQQNQPVKNVGNQVVNLDNQDAISSFLERGRASTRMDRTQY
ncbi:hypothetical protein DPMN_157697 [Dreissena polymorpha]|uniref:Uncharacterized protein n=1 Tax=Dreissena polymorpha TaxID=45954 RepID=A0A9D4EFX6_DREPO|nr:hypothetical protein DPMN_157697 [Dreissena polymorpha]